MEGVVLSRGLTVPIDQVPDGLNPRHDVGMDDSPSLKYAHVECERKFLVDGVPAAWRDAIPRTVHDRYISGTRLRLRKVEAPGEETVWKLGQKVRVNESSPLQVAHTTIYLNQVEANLLAALPADGLAKIRRTAEVNGHLWAVDEFRERLAGLFLAEVDLGDDRQMSVVPPFDVNAEVTTDDRFSGGQLARMTGDQLKAILAAVLS
jgi:CYTH domain-containing protein